VISFVIYYISALGKISDTDEFTVHAHRPMGLFKPKSKTKLHATITYCVCKIQNLNT